MWPCCKGENDPKILFSYLHFLSAERAGVPPFLGHSVLGMECVVSWVPHKHSTNWIHLSPLCFNSTLLIVCTTWSSAVHSVYCTKFWCSQCVLHWVLVFTVCTALSSGVHSVYCMEFWCPSQKPPFDPALFCPTHNALVQLDFILSPWVALGTLTSGCSQREFCPTRCWWKDFATIVVPPWSLVEGLGVHPWEECWEMNLHSYLVLIESQAPKS